MGFVNIMFTNCYFNVKSISYGKNRTTRRDNFMRVRVYDKVSDSYFINALGMRWRFV